MRIYKQWKSKLLKRKYLLIFQSMKYPNTESKGIALRVVGTTLHTIGLDYDNIKDERLDEELISLQELFHLGDFVVLATSEYARHAICVDELTLREALNVVYASNCDWLFKKGIRINEYRTWVLRGWEKGERPKPTYLRTVESPYNGNRDQSQAHAEYLKAKFGVDVRLVKPDGNHQLEIQGYLTSSLVTVKDLLKEMKKHG